MSVCTSDLMALVDLDSANTTVRCNQFELINRLRNQLKLGGLGRWRLVASIAPG
jgi:hypothetical protein